MKRLNTDSHIESLTPAQTLRELLEVVDKPEGHLPTMKEMRSRTNRLFTYSDGKSELVVYQCGFFTYSVGGRHTVQRIDSCLKPVQYKTVTDNNISIPAEALLDEPFQIRLTLEGEARIAANRESSEQKRTFRMDTLDMESADLNDPESDFAARMLAEEDARDMHRKLTRAFATLTERQRIAAIKHFIQGKTYQEIAAELGCSRQTAYEIAACARKKLRKSLDEA